MYHDAARFVSSESATPLSSDLSTPRRLEVAPTVGDLHQIEHRNDPSNGLACIHTRMHCAATHGHEDGYSERQALELELESLVMPEADAAKEAGRLIEKLPDLWSAANQQQRRKLLLTMLDAVYVDARDEKRIVAIKPKAPFHQLGWGDCGYRTPPPDPAYPRPGPPHPPRGRRPTFAWPAPVPSTQGERNCPQHTPGLRRLRRPRRALCRR